jgi:ubiquitin-protein ligase
VTALILPGCGDPDGVTVLHPRSGRARAVAAEDLARLTTLRGCAAPTVLEIVAVCLDTSVSMRLDLDGHAMTRSGEKPARICAALQYLTTFADRLYGFRVPALLSLVCFDQNVRTEVGFSALSADFAGAARRAASALGRQTKLWDAVDFALRSIAGVRDAHAGANCRIMVISDGEDDGSAVSVVDVANAVLAAGIRVDSVHLGDEEQGFALARLSQLSGGLLFRPADPAAGLRIFEKESFLCVALRPERRPAAVRVTKEEFVKRTIEYDEDVENVSLMHVTRRQIRLDTPRAAMKWAKAEGAGGGRCRRVLAELREVGQRPIPGVTVYVTRDNVFEWKAFVEGPSKGVGGRPLWPLAVVFPAEYPEEPPLLRFSIIPYHLNVSVEGRVCIDAVTTRYVHTASVREILVAVWTVMSVPQRIHAVQIEKLWNFVYHREEYEREVAQSALNAYQNETEATFGVKIRDEAGYVPPEPEPRPAVQILDTGTDTLRLCDLSGALLTSFSDDDFL